MGGTFNPIHLGHLRSAEEILEKEKLDKIIFITSFNPPHKNAKIIPFYIRKEMVKSAIQDNPNFIQFEIEEEIEGFSYTYQTLNKLSSHFPKASLFFIMGADNISQLENWKKPKEIIKLAKIIITNRPGFSLDKNYELIMKYPDRFVFCAITDLAISSTKIRECLAENLSVRYLVPENVNILIDRYKDEILSVY